MRSVPVSRELRPRGNSSGMKGGRDKELKACLKQHLHATTGIETAIQELDFTITANAVQSYNKLISGIVHCPLRQKETETTTKANQECAFQID